MDLTRKDYHAALRQNFNAFVDKCFGTINAGENFYDNWHLWAMAYQLDRIRRGEINRLMITLPPRNLKSIVFSVAYPAFMLGHNPTLQFLCVSHSMTLALRHARDCRRVMESVWYQTIFPRTRLDPNKNSEADFMTTRGGYRIACSVGGTITGRGGNHIILDDANKADDAVSETALNNVNEWYHNTLLSRLNNKRTDPIIVVQQRLHENDLAGHLLASPGWSHLNLPAIAEDDEAIPIAEDAMHHRKAGDVLHAEREPIETLNELKEKMGSMIFAAQYQQRPVPLEGGMVKWDWFVFYTDTPEKTSQDQVVQSWDTASKPGEDNDYSVCTTWLIRKNQYYLMDVYRDRLEYPDLLAKIQTKAKRHKADRVIIEDKGAGTSVIQDLKRSSNLTIVKFEPKEDKQTRLYTVTNVIEGGKVLLPKEAPWLDLFRHEILMFPKGKHDDQVDSTSQFLQWAKRHGQPAKLEIYVAYSPYANDYYDPLLHPSLYYGPPRRW